MIGLATVGGFKALKQQYVITSLAHCKWVGNCDSSVPFSHHLILLSEALTVGLHLFRKGVIKKSLLMFII